MSGQLENPEDPHYSEYLGNPPHLSLVARMLTLALNLVDVYLNGEKTEVISSHQRKYSPAHQRHNQGHEVGEDSKKINDVHDPLDKPSMVNNFKTM